MLVHPPRDPRTYTPCPYLTLSRSAAPARRTPGHDRRPRRVVPRTAMDHPRPANHDPPVVATVAAVMAAVVAIGAAIVPVPVVVATAISGVVAAAVVAARATVAI